MSDATDPPNEEREGEQSAESVAPVRERMRRFLADHDPESPTERADRGGGKPLSEIVIEGREERL